MGAVFSLPTLPKQHVIKRSFWHPQALPAVVPLTRISQGSDSPFFNFDPQDFPNADIRRVSEGWYVFLRLDGFEHRILLSGPRSSSSTYAAVLALDAFFELRAHATRRLWRALSGRPPGPDYRKLPLQRRARLIQSMRALDARQDGASYRAIAEVLFGAERVPKRAWNTHDLRNRTIRLVQSGVALMRGEYINLLSYPLRRR